MSLADALVNAGALSLIGFVVWWFRLFGERPSSPPHDVHAVASSVMRTKNGGALTDHPEHEVNSGEAKKQ